MPWGGIGAGAGLATSFWQCSINFAPERAIALSSSKAKSSLLMFVVATCVYRKLKLGHNGDAVRQGSRGNGYFQLVELGARKARPYLASDAFAIHYNRRHTRLESDAGALGPV